MRLPDPKVLEPLLKLSNVRKRAAEAELSRLAALRDAAAKGVAELAQKVPTCAPDTDGSVLEKWLVWKKQELVRRQARLAKCRADYAASALICGRVIAEHDVVDDLTRQASDQATSVQTTRDMEELILQSHLLSHNVGDQDI